MESIVLLIDRISVNYRGIAYSYFNTFKSLGYKVDLVSFETNENIYRYTKLFPLINELYLSSMQGSIIQAIDKSNSQFVFVIKGFYLLPKTLEILKNKGIKVVCFNPDDPFSSISGSSNKNVKDCILLYDAYFIWNHRLVSKINNYGLENVYYLPFYPDNKLLKPNKRTNNTKCIDISFVGNGDKERNLFMNKLGNLIQSDQYVSEICGVGWTKVNGFDVKGQAYNEEFLETIYNSKINLNVLRTQNKGSHNMRTFDIPACGGFMLHEYSDEVVDFFEPGKEMDTFKSVEECLDKIHYYINNEKIREKIALNGYNRVISAKYNYESNINSIFNSLKINNL